MTVVCSPWSLSPTPDLHVHFVCLSLSIVAAFVSWQCAGAFHVLQGAQAQHQGLLAVAGRLGMLEDSATLCDAQAD